MAQGGLEEKQPQKENLKDIDQGHKNILQSLRSPKGPKHYLVIVRVKDSFLQIRNQTKKMSCNDNTPLKKKNSRLKYQPTKKTETSENSFVDEMAEARVPVGHHWKYCYESCKAVEQRLEEIQVQRTRDDLIKTLESLENSMWQGSHAARLTR